MLLKLGRVLPWLDFQVESSGSELFGLHDAHLYVVVAGPAAKRRLQRLSDIDAVEFWSAACVFHTAYQWTD